jgi:hypothetical protein
MLWTSTQTRECHLSEPHLGGSGRGLVIFLWVWSYGPWYGQFMPTTHTHSYIHTHTHTHTHTHRPTHTHTHRHNIHTHMHSHTHTHTDPTHTQTHTHSHTHTQTFTHAGLPLLTSIIWSWPTLWILCHHCFALGSWGCREGCHYDLPTVPFCLDNESPLLSTHTTE